MGEEEGFDGDDGSGSGSRGQAGQQGGLQNFPSIQGMGRKGMG